MAVVQGEPEAIAPQAENFPDELKALPQWVCWRYEPPLRPGDKWRKVPYTPGGGRASTTNPRTWRDFKTARTLYNNGSYAGLGFVFVRDGGFIGIDLDDCRDPKSGAIAEWVGELLDDFDTYSEASVSGVGVHLLVKGAFPPNEEKRRGHVEMYQERRFFTMTGLLVRPNLEVGYRQAQIDTLRSKLFVRPPEPAREPDRTAITFHDAEILNKIASAKNGPAFQALYNGEIGAHYFGSDGSPDLSRADFGLIGLLKFYTQDPAQLERLMRASKLCRPKWDTRRGNLTWIQYSIQEGLKGVSEHYSPPADPNLVQHNGNGHKPGAVLPDADSGQEDEDPSDDDTETTEEPAEDQPKPRYLLHHISEAFEPEPPIPWVVEGMLARGSVALFVGAGGTKKTYTLIDLGICVALGEPWLTFQTVQGRVLIIDEESGNRRLKHRFGEILRGHGADELTPVWYTSIAGFNLRQPVDVAHVTGLVEEVQPSLVIIDALVDVMPGGDENAAQEVHPVFHALRRIAEAYNCAIIVIHHANRAGEYRGSTAMHGAVDLMLMVKSLPKEKMVTFESAKVRDTEDLQFAALAEWDSLRKTFTLSAAVPESIRTNFSDSELFVLGYLQKAPHHRATLLDIENHADSCSEAMARKATRRLAKRGFVRRCDAGGAGVRATYELTSQTRTEEKGDE